VILGDIGPLCVSYQSSVTFLLSVKHNYIDLMYLVLYSILLLHVSAVHICHHQVGQWYTQKKGRGLSL